MLHKFILFALGLLTLLHPLNSSTVGELAIASGEKYEDLRSTYHNANCRVFLIDNDGVLKPKPGAGDLSQEHRNKVTTILSNLSKDPRNHVWVITGRSEDHIMGMYPNIERLNYAGQMGLVFKRAGEGKTYLFPELVEQTTRLGAALQYEAASHGYPPEAVIIRAGSVLFDFNRIGRQAVDADREIVQQFMLRLRSPQYSFTRGSNNLFFTLTHMKCNKGELATKLLSDYAKSNHKPFFGISFGDELIDEPMHRVMNMWKPKHSTSIVVSEDPHQPTEALLRLPNYEAVYQVLEGLANLE